MRLIYIVLRVDQITHCVFKITVRRDDNILCHSEKLYLSKFECVIIIFSSEESDWFFFYITICLYAMYKIKSFISINCFTYSRIGRVYK